MRIGLSTTTIEPTLTQGKLDGIGVYTKHLYEELLKQNQKIIPCSFPNGINNSNLPNGTLFKLPFTHSTLLSLVGGNLHRKLEKNIDIFHSTDHMVPKLKNIPTIVTLNDALMLKHPEWYGAKFRTLKNWIRKKTVTWADHFITISNAMVPELVKYWGIKEDKISVIYDGISDEWLQEISPETKKFTLQKLNLPDQFILFTGTLQPKKNIPRLVQAFLKLPRDIQETYPLVIVGKDGWNSEESLNAIKQLQDKKRGFWLNYVSTTDLRVLFQSATLYLYPSLHEGFGLTLLEAFASKTPVLTSNVAALPETAHGAAYLIDPHSVDEMSMAVKTLLTTSSLREELIKKGALRVKEFSWKKCAEETLKIYKHVISQS